MVPTEELRRSIPSPLGVTLQPLPLCSSKVTDKLLWVIEATCASLLRLAHIPRPLLYFYSSPSQASLFKTC